MHPLFAGDAAELLGAVVRRIASTNMVAHPTNAIDMAPAMAQAIGSLM